MFCTKCGKKITLGAEFCGFCGTPITPEQEEIRDSTQNINQAQSGYPSDWSNDQSNWSNEQYDDPRFEQSRSSQSATNEIKVKKKGNSRLKEDLKGLGLALGAALVAGLSSKIGLDAMTIFTAIAFIAIGFNILKFIFRLFKKR